MGTIEALTKKLSGELIKYSEQYFVDCTFTYSGCAGGTVNEGYKLTLMRQYMLSAKTWPYTADCKFLTVMFVSVILNLLLQLDCVLGMKNCT